MYKAFILAEVFIIICLFIIIVILILPSILSDKYNKDWVTHPNIDKIKIDKTIDYDFTK